MMIVFVDKRGEKTPRNAENFAEKFHLYLAVSPRKRVYTFTFFFQKPKFFSLLIYDDCLCKTVSCVHKLLEDAFDILNVPCH